MGGTRGNIGGKDRRRLQGTMVLLVSLVPEISPHSRLPWAFFFAMRAIYRVDDWFERGKRGE